MNIRDKVLSYIDKHNLISRGDRLLIACSGGSDSMALLHFLHNEKIRLGIEVSAVHVNHMLREEESDEDCRFVERFCSERQIPFYAKSIPIPQIVAEEKGNVQAICRRERYDYFKEVMEHDGFNVLVLGHHADDQLESVFIGLIRGTMLNGAVGIVNARKFGNGRLIRPFLSIEKKAIHQYILSHQLSYREDSSNEKDDYTRNRFRHHISPLIYKENPKAAQAILKWSESTSEDDRYLTELAALEFGKLVKKSKNTFSFDSKSFKEVAPALQRRVVLLLLNYLYEDTQIFKSDVLIDAMLQQCSSVEGHAELHLPDGARLIRQYSKVTVSRNTLQIARQNQELNFPQETWIGTEDGLQLMWSPISTELKDLPESVEKWYFQLKESEFPLTIRTRREGDRIHLPNMAMTKKLSRVFIDEKVAKTERDTMSLIVSSKDEVLAAPKIRFGNSFSPVCKEFHQYILFIAAKDI